MGYSLELGYADEVIDAGHYKQIKGFEQTTVNPFRAGSNVALDPGTLPSQRGFRHRFLGSLLRLFRDEPKESINEMPLATDDEGMVPAEVDITFNYSKRIGEITGSHLSNLHGQRAAEGGFMLMQLVAGLEAEKGDTEDYWRPTDGNIKHLAETLLDWTVQHPNAVFHSVA